METNELIHLPNASNLTLELFYDNFNKKILLNFLVKNDIKNSCVKFAAFSRRNGSFFSSKGVVEKRKC